MGSLPATLLLLLLLFVVGGQQVSPEPCEVGQIVCREWPRQCCQATERPWLQALPRPPAPPSSPDNANQYPLPPVQAPPIYPHVLPVWTNWYFCVYMLVFGVVGRVMVALLVVSCLAGCGYWRKRKIYESSASQTLGHAHIYGTPTPSDDTPMYGPPLPFLPPTPYPAPPPYSEAARPSFDPLEQHLYDAMLSGRSVYDFYDRRHPNAYYDRYFLPDDTSSSETTSLLSYRLHRSCSAHLPRHHSLRKCDMLAPPPYSEVAAKPELYPVVVMRGGITEVNSSKSMTEGSGLTHPSAWHPSCHHYIYRSDSVLWIRVDSESVQWRRPARSSRGSRGSVSTPEGSQSSSYTCGATLQSEFRGGRVSSPGGVLALASPASSVGPHASDVSSLPPTSPPSPPAPTSPTLPPSPATRELRDVLHKISQLPGAASPPPALTPSLSPLSPHHRLLTHHTSSHSRYSPPRTRGRRPLGASLSLEVSGPSRPRSLPLNAAPPSSLHLDDPPSPLLTASASTPNLSSSWPSPPSRTPLVASLVGGSRVVHHPATHAHSTALSPGEGNGEWARDSRDARFTWRARDAPEERV